MRDVSATGSAPRPEQTKGSPYHTLRRDRLEEGSARYAKIPVISTGFAPPDLHILDIGLRRTPSAPGNKDLNLLFWPFRDRFDLAGREVPHFPREPEPLRLVPGACAVEHALDEP